MLDKIYFFFAGLFGSVSVTGLRHRSVCPRCRRRLVNTYKRAGKWRCHRCWVAAGAKTEEVKRYA